jgi:hypothetical protein
MEVSLQNRKYNRGGTLRQPRCDSHFSHVLVAPSDLTGLAKVTPLEIPRYLQAASVHVRLTYVPTFFLSASGLILLSVLITVQLFLT